MDQTLTFFCNGSFSLYLDSFAYFSTQSYTWLLFYVSLFYVLVRHNNFRQLIILLTILLLGVIIVDQIASGLFKPWVARWRPSNDPKLRHIVDIVGGYRGGSFGFFSSHAANTSFIATFLILLFRHRITTLTFIGWVLLNCWTRLFLGVHYLGDIIAGLFCGVLIASFAYIFYCKTYKNKNPKPYPSLLLLKITTMFLITLLVLSFPFRLIF